MTREDQKKGESIGVIPVRSTDEQRTMMAIGEDRRLASMMADG